VAPSNDIAIKGRGTHLTCQIYRAIQESSVVAHQESSLCIPQEQNQVRQCHQGMLDGVGVIRAVEAMLKKRKWHRYGTHNKC
jgi:hypothetical protein